MKTRKLGAVLLAAGLLAGLTACGDSPESVRKNAEIVKTCKDSGGVIRYNMINEIFCVWKEEDR